MVLVNHTWNDLFTPHLWKDVINYRTLRALGEGERKFKWNCDHYFHSPAGRQALAKHSCHIQALTCRDQAILPLLVEAGCTHLLEINHIVYDSYRCHSPEYVPTDDQGLSDLAALVIINPRLLAVSVEGFHIGEMGEAQELADFLDLLEHNCPNVTCLCLHVDTLSRDLSNRVMFMVLMRRVGLVDTSKIMDLDIRQYQGFDRSERGPPLPLSSAEED